MSKRLILIRHAHRDTDEPGKDNGLSGKGNEQVKRLLKFASDRLDDTDPMFISSPKKRCQETLGPIAKMTGHKMEIDERLTEHGPTESTSLYLARIDEFLDHWKFECPDTTVVSSHGDWIPIAVQRLTGAKIGLKKAGWVEIEYAGGECFLTWIVQKV
ncbi:MAG: histidine phosphatase family protein [Bdellovibrionales bacterium]|nr:histidine phosphatase family protein [Bdellovibrionales bacterium]